MVALDQQGLKKEIKANRIMIYRILTEKCNMPESKAKEFMQESVELSEGKIPKKRNK